MTIPIIDLFAGPGGLCEGFSALKSSTGVKQFAVKLSIEKDVSAHQTLLLRSIFRSFPSGKVPQAYYRYIRGEIKRDDFFDAPEINHAYKQAMNVAKCAELGKTSELEVDGWISSALGKRKDWVLIGGPPCQAYSLVGRSRMRGADPTRFESDERHFLYREYLRILKKFSPAIFVMENVKGILSSKHGGEPIFEKITADLEQPGGAHKYMLRSFVVPGEITDPRNYVIACERYGLPQARHRVIIFGIREDIFRASTLLQATPEKCILQPQTPTTVRDVLGGLPAIRSKLSGRSGTLVESKENWDLNMTNALDMTQLASSAEMKDVFQAVSKAVRASKVIVSTGAQFLPTLPPLTVKPLDSWLCDPEVGGVISHESRSHMASDLHRYLFAASMSTVTARRLSLDDFPRALMPAHANAASADAPFSDRFRVQAWSKASTTVVSHISKDGHYYIHPDPAQCRSLTVREAARLQTFPDNYYFEGNKTAQYHQVGNAVPPYLAFKLAAIVGGILIRA